MFEEYILLGSDSRLNFISKDDEERYWKWMTLLYSVNDLKVSTWIVFFHKTFLDKIKLRILTPQNI